MANRYNLYEWKVLKRCPIYVLSRAMKRSSNRKGLAFTDSKEPCKRKHEFGS